MIEQSPEYKAAAVPQNAGPIAASIWLHLHDDTQTPHYGAARIPLHNSGHSPIRAFRHETGSCDSAGRFQDPTAARIGERLAQVATQPLPLIRNSGGRSRRQSRKPLTSRYFAPGAVKKSVWNSANSANSTNCGSPGACHHIWGDPHQDGWAAPFICACQANAPALQIINAGVPEQDPNSRGFRAFSPDSVYLLTTSQRGVTIEG